MNEPLQNTRSFVRQFRQVLMGLYSGQYDIGKISIESDLDRRVEFPEGPRDIEDRILTVKYNIFRKGRNNKKDKDKKDGGKV